jgi:hypothetical protein
LQSIFFVPTSAPSIFIIEHFFFQAFYTIPFRSVIRF